MGSDDLYKVKSGKLKLKGEKKKQKKEKKKKRDKQEADDARKAKKAEMSDRGVIQLTFYLGKPPTPILISAVSIPQNIESIPELMPQK